MSEPAGPGRRLFDVHTHFLPPRVRAKVLEQFDTAGPLIGAEWPVRYRGTDEELVQTLRGLGVERFSALAYAHRPDMAEWLNDWTSDFADRVPECLRCATFYPEPGVGEYVAARLGADVGRRVDGDYWRRAAHAVASPRGGAPSPHANGREASDESHRHGDRPTPRSASRAGSTARTTARPTHE